MTTNLTYTERSAAMERAADAARLERIEELFKRFNEFGRSMGDNLVSSVNIAREIGMELQGISGTEQLGFGFFQAHCKSLPFDFEKAKRFVAIARTQRTEVRTKEEAIPVMQQVFFNNDLLQIPGRRDGPQRSHETPLVTFVFTTLGTAWERIEQRFKVDGPKLDVESRQNVRKEIERFEKKAEELKAML